MRLREFWNVLGMNQRVSLILAATFLTVGMGGLFFWASQPRMELLFGRLDQAELAEVVKQLDEAGSTYELRGSSALYVRAEEVHSLRLKLAAEGIPQGGEDGYELFDRPTLGFSEFMQQTNYLRALQGELSRTIVKMNRVRSARVMVVMPKDRLFLNGEAVPATASVFVDTGGAELPLHSVNAVRHLVANAVEGLKPEQVAVVDNLGRVLTEGLNENGPMAAMSGQWRARRELEEYFRQQIETLLTPVTGPSGVIARVAVELNNEGFTKVERVYDPDGQVIRSRTKTEDNSASNEAREGLRPGGLTSELQPDGQVAATGPTSTSNDIRKSETIAYEINESTTETTVVPGGLKQVSASVMLALRIDPETGASTPRTPEELDRVRTIVANAIGVRSQPDWTERVSVAEMVFDSAVVSPEIPPMPWYGVLLEHQRLIIQLGALGLAAMIFLWFVRLLKKARTEFQSLEPVERAPSSAVDVTPRVTPEMINELVDQRAEQVGAALQNWVREDV